MNLFKKKINVLGKSVPAALIMLLALSIPVTAATIAYYGTIRTEVTVEQGLTIDGNAWDVPIEEEATIYSTHEETVTSGNHQLQNTADNDVVVKLVSTCSADKPNKNSCEDTDTITLFELSIPEVGVVNSVQDRVVVKPNVMTINDIATLSFDYKLTKTTNGNSPYFVLGLDTNDDGVQDGWVVSWQDKNMAVDTWHTHGSGLLFHIPVGLGSTVCTQSTPCDLAGVQEQIGGAELLEVKAMLGYWGDTTATTALVKDIEVNNVLLADVNGIIVPDDTFSDENGHVDFSIETHFPQGTLPATYTITTTATPA